MNGSNRQSASDGLAPTQFLFGLGKTKTNLYIARNSRNLLMP